MHGPACVVVLADGSRRRIDLFARSASGDSDWAASLARVVVHAIELSGFRFDQQLSLEQLDRLLRSSSTVSPLQTLVLEDCVLTDRVVAFLVEYFVHTDALSSLLVRRCRQLSMTSLVALTSLINASPLLTHLELSCCQLARQAGMLLGQALPTARSLQRLDVSGNILRDGGLKAIADGVRAAAIECLEELNCSGNGISSAGVAAVAALPVKRLVIKDNNITAFPSIGNRVLECLDLSGNAFSPDSLQELLVQALQTPSLTSLHIQNCGLTKTHEAILTKALLLSSSSTTKACRLRELYVGETTEGDDLLDDKDADPEQPARLLELKTCLETKVVGLTIHLLAPLRIDEEEVRGPPHGHEERNGTDRRVSASAFYHVEPETPGRQTRRELLERTEFMRRHSEELPLDDDDESLASFVSEKLLNNCLPPKPLSRSATSVYRTASLISVSADDESEMVSVSRRPSASSVVPPPQHHAASSASFCLHHTNPSLDDVASQFSIDPPPSATASTLQNTDVEFIVSRTIDTMNRNFEQRLTQFLMRMEFQQQEKNANQLQTLAAKVEACERTIPRLEARLDVLADRIATSGAQVAKMQNEWQTKQPTTVHATTTASLAATTPLTLAMQHQVDELVASRLRSNESHLRSEVAALRREVSVTTATATQTATPQAVVDTVSVHLMQFKHEFDANQATVLRRFTENIMNDGDHVDERMQELEGKVAHLEGIIQAEQHASLLALEAISEAFAGNTNTNAQPPLPHAVPVAPLPPPPHQHQHQHQQHQLTYVSKPIQQHGYSLVQR